MHTGVAQNQLARRVPFCWATMLGSHNSGITLADGYGALDPYFQKYFEWVKFAVRPLLRPALSAMQYQHRTRANMPPFSSIAVGLLRCEAADDMRHPGSKGARPTICCAGPRGR